MPTYLVAFIISDFESKSQEGENGKIQHRVHGREAKIHQAEFILDVSERILHELELYTKFEYPINKMDQIGLPDYKSTAMGNFGLVTYRENAFYYNEEDDLFDKKNSIIMLVAHEFAQQWFGNIVTLEWWTYNWLNVGFASLFASLIMDRINNNTKEIDGYALRVQSVMQSDASDNTRPMNFEPAKQEMIMDLFDNIACTKG